MAAKLRIAATYSVISLEWPVLTGLTVWLERQGDM